jgi:membrane protein implicated in regulation of membrane protease activity
MNLFLAGLLSILCAIFKDAGFGIFALNDVIAQAANVLNHVSTPAPADSGWQSTLSFFFPVLVFWLLWAVIFRRATRSDDPETLLNRAVRWLLRGSILELFVAVPSHVIARRRDDCCAPAGTFWGIATGISVMLLCFGPGVYFLFVERIKKLRPPGTRSTTLRKK